MARIDLDQVVKHYANFPVIHGIDLHIDDGEFVVFVGPSGCGKSTLLRMIAGLEQISSGRFAIDGEPMNDVEASRRGIAMVFQSYALYPHMSVRKNLAFGLETQRMPKSEISTRVDRAADILQITHLLDRKPKALSGGQRQRVAIGRAIVREPKIFLFDEPLSNLDAELRVAMRVEIAKLHRELGNTMIYVTHDQTEAMTMADKIVVLRAGRIEQVGRPLDLYNDPANRFVAGFLGSPKMNFLDVSFAGADPVLAGQRFDLDMPGKNVASIGVRPEHLEVLDVQGAAKTIGEITVEHSEQLGSGTLLYGRLCDGQRLTISVSGQRNISMGDRLHVGALAQHIHMFDASEQTVRPENFKIINENKK